MSNRNQEWNDTGLHVYVILLIFLAILSIGTACMVKGMDRDKAIQEYKQDQWGLK